MRSAFVSYDHFLMYFRHPGRPDGPETSPCPAVGRRAQDSQEGAFEARAMTRIFAERSAEKRREGEALIREADNLACQSWKERM
jgi:hypothetical protein